MNNVAMSFLTFMMLIVLFAPRRWALLGMMAGLLFLTQGQTINILGLNIFPGRFLEVAGFSRVMIRREFFFRNLTKIDHAWLILYSYAIVVYAIRNQNLPAYTIGVTVDAVLCYFTFRGLIENIDDFSWFLSAFLALLAPYTVLVLIERFTHHNVFAFMGGIFENALDRGDRPRCWGSFRHPILLGDFGASFLPLYIGIGLAKRSRIIAIVGACLCIGIVYASNSGGPLTAVVIVIAGWLLWSVRSRMSLVRRSIVGTIVFLGIIMKAPIWYLTARISNLVGGDGWHRGYLLDISLQNIGKWWLAGMTLSETHDWFPYTSELLEGADITNVYLAFGLTGGLGAMGLFVLVLTRAFSSIGKAAAVVREVSMKSAKDEFVLWGLGVMLAVHTVAWLGVCYFDQMNMIWFMQLAAVSSITKAYTAPPEEMENIITDS